MRLVAGVAEVGDVDAFVANLDDVGDEYGCAVQAFDADYVADRAHLAAAVERANRAFDRGENVASERAVEILLYAAGRRQIRRALEMGVGEGERRVVVVVDSESRSDSEQSSGQSPRDGEGEAGAADAVADLLVETQAFAGAEESLVGDEATLRAFFDVSDAEATVVDDLSGVVRERVALLDVEK